MMCVAGLLHANVAVSQLNILLSKNKATYFGHSSSDLRSNETRLEIKLYFTAVFRFFLNILLTCILI